MSLEFQSHFRQIKLLLVLCLAMLALQYVPIQAVKDLFGIALFVIAITAGGVYLFLFLLDAVLTGKIAKQNVAVK